MVTSVIGKIFLEAYNEKHNKAYTPKSFFVEVYYPRFFGHEKYLMTAGNSPFENPKLSWKDMILGRKPFESADRRKERLDKFLAKIDTGLPDASIAVGYPSVDALSTTSGQVSIVREEVDPSECYLSWIGAGLGIGVQGGLTILFSKPDILLDIADGWDLYRNYLNTTPRMRGNQINTWNGQWLKKKYNTRDSSASLDFTDKFSIKDDLVEIQTLPWVDLIAAVSRRFPDPRMMGYVYNIGQTNTTVGFIPFVLSPIRKVHDLYEHHFGTKNSKKAMKLFGTAFGFSMACKEGVIGLKALEPKGLSSLMKKGKIPSYKSDDEEQIIQYETYQIWLLAMLNNEELWDKAKAFAQTLQDFSLGGKTARTVRSNMVKILLESTNKRAFIDGMGKIVEEAGASMDEFEDMASTINTMPSDNVPYFLTLMRFHYAVINNKNTNNE